MAASIAQRAMLTLRGPSIIIRCKSTQQVVQYRGNKPAVQAAVNGTPATIAERTVRISIPARATTQSGTFNNRTWQVTWDTQERWENPLMGWISSADPMSNLKMNFDTKEAAMDFCEKQGWKYYVHEPYQKKALIQPKSYGANFSWAARTRLNTK